MPQVFTHQLNRTITGIVETPGAPNFDSLSVRITDVPFGSVLKLFGITWNLTGTDGNGLNDALYTRLLVLKNEKFNPGYQYNNPQVDQQKEVVFRYTIIPQRGNPAVAPRVAIYNPHLNFVPALKLQGASDYLVIVTPPVRIAGSAPYRITLTVRGEIEARRYK